MVAVKSEGKWKFVLLVLVLKVYTSVCTAMNDTESEIIEWISRRQSYDVYNYINSTFLGFRCEYENRTYLIRENQCVEDQEVFKGKLIF